jgi:hypothetical protein
LDGGGELVVVVEGIGEEQHVVDLQCTRQFPVGEKRAEVAVARLVLDGR